MLTTEAARKDRVHSRNKLNGLANSKSNENLQPAIKIQTVASQELLQKDRKSDFSTDFSDSRKDQVSSRISDDSYMEGRLSNL